MRELEFCDPVEYPGYSQGHTSSAGHHETVSSIDPQEWGMSHRNYFPMKHRHHHHHRHDCKVRKEYVWYCGHAVTADHHHLAPNHEPSRWMATGRGWQQHALITTTSSPSKEKKAQRENSWHRRVEGRSPKCGAAKWPDARFYMSTAQSQYQHMKSQFAQPRQKNSPYFSQSDDIEGIQKSENV